MASASEIKIVNISNLEKIESFLNDSAYREIIENSETYNTRLCIERRLRMPFLDPQTGVAQNHSALFMKKIQRMPGLREGQIYSYPATRWRKSRRQYLVNPRPFGIVREQIQHHDADSLGIDSSSIGAGDTDSKDSQNVRDEVPKEWYYDEMDMHEMEAFHDPEADSDFDFDDHYGGSGRKRKRKSTARGGGGGGGRTFSDTPTKRGAKTGRGRRKNASLFNSDSPHTPGTSARGRGRGASSGSAPHISHNSSLSPLPPLDDTQMPILTPEKCVTDENSSDEVRPKLPGEHMGKAAPSPYCDFCLGDARENKKTKIPEDLVSCSNCGRSGHPTCLQFTPNMIVSVKRYRWQCIECKYCSICGTSDNDDQLLFCDDCDRGYHMYCLVPPLTVPPEGSWSCKLCLEEFHNIK